MKVFMIGGTGLLGCEAARIFIERGHEVKSVALPPLPEGAPIPPEMDIEFCNIYEKSDEEIKAMLETLVQGCLKARNEADDKKEVLKEVLKEYIKEDSKNE